MSDKVLIDLARRLLDLLEEMDKDYGREFELLDDEWQIICGVCGESLGNCRQISDPRCNL